MRIPIVWLYFPGLTTCNAPAELDATTETKEPELQIGYPEASFSFTLGESFLRIEHDMFLGEVAELGLRLSYTAEEIPVKVYEKIGGDQEISSDLPELNGLGIEVQEIAPSL